MGIWLTSLEDVKSAMDMAETARVDALVARQVDAASRSIEALLNRRDGLAPKVATRYFDWPDDQMGISYRLWLDEVPLLSVDSISSGDTSIASSDYFLEPQRYGPPYTRLEIDLASSASFGGGDTWQHNIVIAGTWGYTDDATPAGTLAAAVSSTSATTIQVSDSSLVGTGHLIRIDDERLQVTRRAMVATGQATTGALTAGKGDVSIPIGDGTAIHLGEVLLIDSERVLVVDIAGNTLTVRRAWDGSVLAAHNIGAAVYAPRQLTVTRAALGTTAATHANGASLTRWTPPADIEQLCIDEAIWRLQNTLSGMARVVGEGDATRMVNARTISIERDQVFAAHGRIRLRGA